MVNNLLAIVIWNNTVYDYLIVVSSLLAGIFLIKIFKKLIINRVTKSIPVGTKQSFQRVVRTITMLLYLGLFYVCLQILNFPIRFEHAVDTLIAIVLGVLFIHVLNNSVLDYVVKRYLKFKGAAVGPLSIQFLLSVFKALVWVIGLIVLADNVGLKVTPLVAGLGIGGVGVALAAQVLLKDLFSCFAIHFDRPFNIGDFIIVGDFLGTVEHIGIKTTRLRSLGGEELVLSNSDLTESRVRNYKRMQERRVLFDIKVIYDTPIEKLQLISEAIKSIISKVEKSKYDRAHLARFEDRGFVFEIVYYVLTGDYKKYMDIQQEINFKINEEFAKEKIDFAFPTQTIHMEK